jgi:hypothetical protein
LQNANQQYTVKQKARGLTVESREKGGEEVEGRFHCRKLPPLKMVIKPPPSLPLCPLAR